MRGKIIIMMYYILLVIVITFTFLLVQKVIKPKNKENIFLNITFIEMLLFLGLREITIGTDLKNYIPFFQLFKSSDWSIITKIDLEKGFIVFNKLIGFIGGESLFLFITAIVCLVGVYFSIRKFSKNYFFSIFIYITMQFYIFSFSGLRQAMAFSIVWISLNYVQQRKIFKFIFLIFLASIFHKTAVIFIPIYFLAMKRITPKYIGIYSIILCSFFLLKDIIFEVITKFVYTNYTYSQETGGYNLLVLLIAILITSMFIYSKQNEKSKEMDMWINMLMIAILIQSMASVQGNIARLTMYYSYSIVVLIPNIVEEIQDKKARLLIKSVVYSFLMIFFIINLQNENLYMPYECVLWKGGQ